MSNFIKCSVSYDAEITEHGVQKSTKDKRAFEGGKEAYLLYQHLEGINQGNLGIKYQRRVYNTSQRGIFSGSKTLKRGVLQRASSSPKGRNKILAGEGYHFLLQGEHKILLNHFSSPQKEWLNETGNLKHMTQWMEFPHFKLEDIPTLQNLMRQGD